MQQEQLWLLHEALPLVTESCNRGPVNHSVIGSNSNLYAIGWGMKLVKHSSAGLVLVKHVL
jgi:hypothetical protein